MKKIEIITPSFVSELDKELHELLAPLVSKYGMTLDILKEACSEDCTSLAVNLKFSLPPRPESVATLKEEQDFRCYAEGFGMRAAWLGQEFKRGSFTYKVAGLMVNAPKECVVLQRSDGSRCHENGKLVARYLAEG